MEQTRRTVLIYGVLAAFWVLAVGWQIQEHERVKAYARTGLLNRSKDIANTLGAFIRGLQFRGAVFGDRVQPVLDELVAADNDEVFRSGEVISVGLLNAAGEPVAFAGNPLDLRQSDILQQGERWGRQTLTVVYPVQGASVSQDRATNPAAPILLPPFTNTAREPRSFRRDSRGTSTPDEGRSFREGRPPPPPPSAGPGSGRPFWARGLNDQDYETLIQKRELHGLVLALSTEGFHSIRRNDLRMRAIVIFFATVAVLGSGLAWRNLVKSSDLQLRLIRASELNTHLKQMNLAAAGLAHETRNPLNIIRGLAHMISRHPGGAQEIQQRSREIIDEADKVAAQLNEFINYSRPREVRRVPVSLASVITEVTRALNYDIEEKHVRVQVSGEQMSVEADEQLLRQALFNLLLNAVQAVDAGGEVHIVAAKTAGNEAILEIRDNGPGVPPEHRSEIFRPYFTTQKQGTGLGLAVVQQIVLAHGWDIDCLPNEPKGAVFRITHLKLA